MIFAAAALVAAVAWGIVVKIWAEKSARDAVEQWMDRNAPGEIAKVLADILPSQVDGGPEPSPRPAVSQEDQEEALGEEPA